MTATNHPVAPEQRLRKVTAAWTSDTNGDYTESITLNGFLYGMETNPGGTTPSDLYDVTLLNANSRDVLGSNGLNRSNASAQFAEADKYPIPVDGAHTLTIANAGNTKNGTVVLYLLAG